MKAVCYPRSIFPSLVKVWPDAECKLNIQKTKNRYIIGVSPALVPIILFKLEFIQFFILPPEYWRHHSIGRRTGRLGGRRLCVAKARFARRRPWRRWRCKHSSPQNCAFDRLIDKPSCLIECIRPSNSSRTKQNQRPKCANSDQNTTFKDFAPAAGPFYLWGSIPIVL
jgi:hypothetical protein